MLPFCGLSLIFVGFFFSLFLIVQRHIRQQWAGVADATSLTFESGGILPTNRIYGIYRGRPILVDSTLIQINLSWTRFERIRLPLRDIRGLTLEVRTQGIIGRVGRKLQPPKHLAKVEQLPRRYLIEGKPTRFASLLLNEDTPFGRLFQGRNVYQLLVENDEIQFIKPIDIRHSKDKLLEIIDTLVDSAEFCEQTIESALPKRYSQRKALPSLSQFLAQTKAQDLNQVEDIKRSGSQSCVVIFLLLSFMFVLGYCFLLWIAGQLA